MYLLHVYKYAQKYSQTQRQNKHKCITTHMDTFIQINMHGSL